MRRRAGLLASLAMVMLCAALVLVVAGRPDPALLRHPLVASALAPIGVTRPDWQTVVVLATRDAALPAAALWATWSSIEDWPRWGGALFTSMRWAGEPGWRVGARFAQELDLGLPFGHVATAETVGAVVPGRLAAWWRLAEPVRSSHVWSFEELPGGGTRVAGLLVLHGPPVGAARLVVEDDWQRRIDGAVDGLIVAARRAR